MEEMKVNTIQRSDLDKEIGHIRDKFYLEQNWIEKFIKEVKATDNYVDKYLP